MVVSAQRMLDSLVTGGLLVLTTEFGVVCPDVGRIAARWVGTAVNKRRDEM